ncbi:MAG: hypothetical protein ACUZ8H_06725, partial [Candidatus Anammoxibacter sp.]
TFNVAEREPEVVAPLRELPGLLGLPNPNANNNILNRLSKALERETTVIHGGVVLKVKNINNRDDLFSELTSFSLS